ncbi:hypothetical protein GGF46_005391 [Coemansia sp. RSA 552]|nr:hypothetical protein GGF46_005391 [Coemansia sp. RSA 552]
MDHPFVLGLRFSFQDTYAVYMATELMSGGTLAQLIKSRRFSEAIVRFWAAELACALHYLHSEHYIAHCSVSPPHILIDAVGHIALSGFDAAVRMTGSNDVEEPSSSVSSYTAPELLRGDRHAYSVDWWALGVIMYECLFGRQPFRSSGQPVLQRMVLEDDVVFPVTTDSRVTLDCMSAIRGLLHKDPRQRLGYGVEGFERLKQHPFFATFDWMQLEERELVPPFIPEDAYATSQLFAEVGECMELQPPPLAPSPDLATLESNFVDFDYIEFQRFKGYIESHNGIDDVSAEAVRAAGTPPESMDLGSTIALSDVPLEYLTLAGEPIVKLSHKSPTSSSDPVMDDSRSETVSLQRNPSVVSAVGLSSHLRAARPTSRAIKQGSKLVRRTTTTAIARLKGRGRRQKNHRIGAIKEEEEEEEEAESPPPTPSTRAPALEPLPSVAEPPPSFVPIDVRTWSQMMPEQQQLARRYCTKMIHENQRLMTMIIQAQEDEDSDPADDKEKMLFQSTYSLTASSLLLAAREGSKGGGSRLLAPQQRQQAKSVAATISAASSMHQRSRPSSRELLLPSSTFHEPRHRAACLSTPDFEVAGSRLGQHRGPSTPSLHAALATSTLHRPSTRRLHAKSAGAMTPGARDSVAIPRLQPIAAGWPPPMPAPLPQQMSMKQQLGLLHGADPLPQLPLPRPPIRTFSSDSHEWDMLPEAADRFELAVAAAVAAAPPSRRTSPVPPAPAQEPPRPSSPALPLRKNTLVLDI